MAKNKKLAKEIKEARQKTGLSIQDAAKALGTTELNIRNVENGNIKRQIMLGYRWIYWAIENKGLSSLVSEVNEFSTDFLNFAFKNIDVSLHEFSNITGVAVSTLKMASSSPGSIKYMSSVLKVKIVAGLMYCAEAKSNQNKGQSAKGSAIKSETSRKAMVTVNYKGAWFKKWRQEKELSATQAASLLCVTHSCWLRMERGERKLTELRLKRIREILSCYPDDSQRLIDLAKSITNDDISLVIKTMIAKGMTSRDASHECGFSGAYFSNALKWDVSQISDNAKLLIAYAGVKHKALVLPDVAQVETENIKPEPEPKTRSDHKPEQDMPPQNELVYSFKHDGQIIPASFTEHDGDVVMTLRQLGEALGYDYPQESAKKLYDRWVDDSDQVRLNSTQAKLACVDGKYRDVLILGELAIIFLALKAGTKRAIAFAEDCVKALYAARRGHNFGAQQQSSNNNELASILAVLVQNQQQQSQAFLQHQQTMALLTKSLNDQAQRINDVEKKAENSKGVTIEQVQQISSHQHESIRRAHNRRRKKLEQAEFVAVNELLERLGVSNDKNLRVKYLTEIRSSTKKRILQRHGFTENIQYGRANYDDQDFLIAYEVIDQFRLRYGLTIQMKNNGEDYDA